MFFQIALLDVPLNSASWMFFQIVIVLIAEGLDLDVNISSRQVSKKLKQMGYKFPRKRRLVGTGGSNQLGEDVRVSGSEVTRPNSHDL